MLQVVSLDWRRETSLLDPERFRWPWCREDTKYAGDVTGETWQVGKRGARLESFVQSHEASPPLRPAWPVLGKHPILSLGDGWPAVVMPAKSLGLGIALAP